MVVFKNVDYLNKVLIILELFKIDILDYLGKKCLFKLIKML